MSSDLTPQEIIISALRLPAIDREQVVEALQESLVDPSIDHGPEDPSDEIRAAWAAELSRRIAEFDAGRIMTIPADEAERMMRGRARPNL